jgi:large subunit ribosomal protein L25
MATEHKISATGRNDEGKGASRRLRRTAQIPAILYGGNAAPQSIQLDHEKTWLASQNEWFYSSILDLDLDGKVQKVLLRDMQRHPYKQVIMHLDFQRVDENQALRAKVPLHFLNQEKSPAGKTAGIVVLHELNEVEVSCLPKDLPEFIEVDLSTLSVGDIVHLSQLKLPAGVEIPELRLGKEHDVAVVIAKHGREEVEETTEAPAADVPAAKVAKKDEDKK